MNWTNRKWTKELVLEEVLKGCDAQRRMIKPPEGGLRGAGVKFFGSWKAACFAAGAIGVGDWKSREILVRRISSHTQKHNFELTIDRDEFGNPTRLTVDFTKVSKEKQRRRQKPPQVK